MHKEEAVNIASGEISRADGLIKAGFTREGVIKVVHPHGTEFDLSPRVIRTQDFESFIIH